MPSPGSVLAASSGRNIAAGSQTTKLSMFARFARGASIAVAHPLAFALSCAFVVAWAASGPAFHYSAEWQLVINTGTTILTFLMVFLIQNAQNREAKAMQLKMDELLRAMRPARNEMIQIENLSEEELVRYEKEFARVRERSARHTAQPSQPAPSSQPSRSPHQSSH